MLVGPADLEGREAPTVVLDLIEASEVIGMHDDPAQGVRRKKDSTLVRAAEAVRDGKASAMISAGNTGATMAAALLRMGRITGVKRPAVATPIPVPGSTPTVLLDAGANSEVQPEWLVQFAQMGSVYAHHRFGIDSPRVGLLSIGEEPGKGDSLRKETYELLCDAPASNFVGNVEGRDVMSADLDVVRDRRIHRQRRPQEPRRRHEGDRRTHSRGVRRRGALQAARRRPDAGAPAALRRR